MPLRSRRHTPCSEKSSLNKGDTEDKIPVLTKSRLFCLAACVLVVIIGCIHSLSDGGVAQGISPSKRSNIAPSTHSFHVVCYGDSLTAGTSPPLEKNQPYAPHLQNELNNIQKSTQASSKVTMPPVVVTWRGNPGWTAEQMLQNANATRAGIVPFVQFSPGTPDVAVLLAGTNDLGHRRSTEDIVADVVALHKLCFKMGIMRTVAVGIPPSAWQASKTEAAVAAGEVNAGIEMFCNETRRTMEDGHGEKILVASLATFVPFPFSFDKEDGKWANDGLHFTPKGYAELGKSLAKPVNEILSDLRHIASKKSKRKGWFRKGSK